MKMKHKAMNLFLDKQNFYTEDGTSPQNKSYAVFWLVARTFYYLEILP